MARSVDLDDLLDATAVAELIGLSTARSVSTYRSRHLDFPEPVLVSSGGRCRYWLRSEIESWVTQRRPES